MAAQVELKTVAKARAGQPAPHAHAPSNTSGLPLQASVTAFALSAVAVMKWLFFRHEDQIAIGGPAPASDDEASPRASAAITPAPEDDTNDAVPRSAAPDESLAPLHTPTQQSAAGAGVYGPFLDRADVPEHKLSAVNDNVTGASILRPLVGDGPQFALAAAGNSNVSPAARSGDTGIDAGGRPVATPAAVAKAPVAPVATPPVAEPTRPIETPRTNHAPVVSAAVRLPDLIVNQSLVITMGALLVNAFDADGDALSVSNLHASSGGLHANGDGTWLFTPVTDDTSDVTFTYQVSDGALPTEQVAYVDLVDDFSTGPVVEALLGTEIADVLVGTDASETIDAKAGDDLIYSMGGNDIVDAGAGDDVVVTGNGNTVIHGGAGNDTIFAGSGNDIIFAGSGDDIVFAGDGNDVVYGGDGNDFISGGSGDDLIDGGAGNDVISGDAGRDVLTGGAGNDVFKVTSVVAVADPALSSVGSSSGALSPGNPQPHEASSELLSPSDTTASAATASVDASGHVGLGSHPVGQESTPVNGDAAQGVTAQRIVEIVDAATASATSDGNDDIDGGAGSDTYDLSNVQASVVVDLGGGVAAGADIGVDKIADIENVIGGSVDDVIVDSAVGNDLSGGGGNDIFVFVEADRSLPEHADRILDLSVGDRIDLSRIDANKLVAEHQVFEFSGELDGQGSGAVLKIGQLAFRFERQADGDHTVLVASTEDTASFDFTVDLVGRHELTRESFFGVS